ncbi:MAG: hypothetical protein JW940_38445, partial [Polyangiaceae bacterium]|nr:hypothetical protein [Polyangiaceae bacterium]
MPGSSSGRARYLRSLADELVSQASRVRDLIGDRHWLSDGAHKEELLRAVLRRHSPSGVEWTRGFVVSPTEDACSSEQDILAVDTTLEAPLFHQSNLAIVFPRAVLAAISVKTTFRKDELVDAVAGLSTLRNVAHVTAAQPTWCGVYFYHADSRADAPAAYRWLEDALRRAPVQRPALDASDQAALGPDAVGVGRDQLFLLNYEEGESDSCRVRGFGLGLICVPKVAGSDPLVSWRFRGPLAEP